MTEAERNLLLLIAKTLIVQLREPWDFCRGARHRAAEEVEILVDIIEKKV